MAEVVPADAFGDAELLGVQHTGEVEPGAILVLGGVNHEGVAVPAADRIAHEARSGSLGSSRPSRKICR